MRYGKWMLLMITALVGGCVLYMASLEYTQTEAAGPELELWVDSGGQVQVIECWADQAGEYYGFLPSYASLDQVTLHFDPRAELTLDGQTAQSGMSCQTLELDTPYPLTYEGPGGRTDTTLTLLRSANIPALYIDTQSGSMDYIHETKGNGEPGQMLLYSPDGALEHVGRLREISGRGNATWLLDKKPYNLTLDYEADLLGMGAAQKWILLSNGYDSSNLRNKIVYDFAGQVGMAYSPECQWVDLYLNGEYAGLYLLSTRNEIHPQRVDISTEGSFLVSMDLRTRFEEKDQPYVDTERSGEFAFRILDTGMDRHTLQDILQSAENAILASDGIDPVTGAYYLDLIDLESWAMRYLVDEVFGNYDGGALSQCFYYDGSAGDGKIYAGPIWDMDNCLSLGGYPPNAIWAGRPHLRAADDAPLFYSLLQKEEFYQRVLELYEQVFRPLAQELLDGELDAYADLAGPAGRLNEARWNSGDMLGDVEDIRSFFESRLAFFDDYYFGNTQYCIVEETNPEGAWRCFAVVYGQSLSWSYYYMDNEEGVYLGYYDAGTDEPFDVDQPLYSDVRIYPKWRYYWEEEGYQMPEQSDGVPLWTMAPALALAGMLVLAGLMDWRRSRKTDGGG